MSDQTAKSKTAPGKAPGSNRNKSAFQTKVWMTLSFLLSAGILAWAFSLPFRNNGPLAKQDPRIEPGATRPVISNQSSAEEYLATAKAMDEEFMRKRAEKARQEEEAIKNLPGAKEAKARWEKHAQRARKEIDALAEAPEGTLEWEHRKQLLENLEDAPL